MAVNISDLLMCVEVDLAFYPAQHQHSKQWNNSVIEVKVNIPMTNKTVIALETWICSAQTRLCRLNQQGWQGAGLLATAYPATWARLIYGRLTRSLFQRVLALRCHYVLAFLNQRPHGPSRLRNSEFTQNFWVYSEFLSFFVLYSRLLADFLSHLGKWVKLIKFEAENECFCTYKVEKPQCTSFTP